MKVLIYLIICIIVIIAVNLVVTLAGIENSIIEYTIRAFIIVGLFTFIRYRYLK